MNFKIAFSIFLLPAGFSGHLATMEAEWSERYKFSENRILWKKSGNLETRFPEPEDLNSDEIFLCNAFHLTEPIPPLPLYPLAMKQEGIQEGENLGWNDPGGRKILALRLPMPKAPTQVHAIPIEFLKIIREVQSLVWLFCLALSSFAFVLYFFQRAATTKDREAICQDEILQNRDVCIESKETLDLKILHLSTVPPEISVQSLRSFTNSSLLQFRREDLIPSDFFPIEQASSVENF